MFTRKLTRSNESLELAPGQVDGTGDTDISGGMVQNINEDAFRGIVQSLYGVLVARGLDEKDINAKVDELANMFKANGDVNDLSYIKRNMKFELEWDKEKDLRKANPGIWSGWWDILHETASGASCILGYSGKALNKLTDFEQALVEQYKKARSEYYDARWKFRQYIDDLAIDALHTIVVKYADAFSKIDKEWFENLSKEANGEYTRMLKRREQKGIKDSPLTRAVEV